MFYFIYNIFTKSIVVLLVSILVVNFIPDFIFHDFPIEPKARDPINFNFVIPEWNNKLSANNPEYIQVNQILGPESVAISKGGLLYTGLADGRIVELDPKRSYKLRNVLKFNPKCKNNVATKSTECGRFLQMRFVNETLYALEANTGLYKVDIRSGAKSFLGPKSASKINLYNSFQIDPKSPNLAYISVSSTRFDLLQIVWSILELEDSGKIVALDLTSGKQVTVVDELMVPNGIDVDAVRDRLVFAETTKASISSIKLPEVRRAFETAKTGDKLWAIRKKVLIPVTPGNPDNIIIQGDLAYIALPFVKLNGKELIDHLALMPVIRRAYARFLFGLGKLLGFVYDNVLPHPLLNVLSLELKSGHINYRILAADKSAVIEYNLSTGATRFFGSDTFGFVSEASPDGQGSVYLGSFRSPFLVKTQIQ